MQSWVSGVSTPRNGSPTTSCLACRKALIASGKSSDNVKTRSPRSAACSDRAVLILSPCPVASSWVAPSINSGWPDKGSLVLGFVEKGLFPQSWRVSKWIWLDVVRWVPQAGELECPQTSVALLSFLKPASSLPQRLA